jgi:preprotein translocase subunit YajC
MIHKAFLAIGLGTVLYACSGVAQTGPLVGTVESTWEDGFEINTGDGTVRVDAWEVCGDGTAQAIAVGDEVTVEGQPSARVFDASAITNAAGEALCASASAAPADEPTTEDSSDATTGGAVPAGSLVGSVERVWEDGFEINTGDGTTQVDAWEVCGDNTQRNITVGDELTVAGELSGGEFDASAITNADGQDVCS